MLNHGWLPSRSLWIVPRGKSCLMRFKDVPEEVWERMPTDGASEHDHYLYGWPKRNH